MKTISIENVEYTYLITKLEKEDGISIKLSELKPNKNISFIYEASTDEIKNDIKKLYICENIEEIICDLNDIFLKDKIIVEKREEKYIMIIETMINEKIKKYEIDLLKKESIDKYTKLLLKLNDISTNFKEIQEEINSLKRQSPQSNIVLNKEDNKSNKRRIKYK